MPRSEGVSEPSYSSSSSELREMGDSPSSSELLDSLSSSSALRFVCFSVRCCYSWLADPGVEKVTRFASVPVVGVASASGPPSAQSRRFAISSVLRTRIGSCSSGSGRVGGGVTNADGAGPYSGRSCLLRLVSGWLEKASQLLECLFHLLAVIDHTAHHLHSRVCCGLLEAVVEQSCFVEHVTRTPQEFAHLLGDLLGFVSFRPCNLDLLLGLLHSVLQLLVLRPERVTFVRSCSQLHVLLQQAVHPGLEVGEVLRFRQGPDPVHDFCRFRIEEVTYFFDEALHDQVLGLYHLVAFPYRIERSPNPWLVSFLLRLLGCRLDFRLLPLRLRAGRSRAYRSRAQGLGARWSWAQWSSSLRVWPTPLSS